MTEAGIVIRRLTRILRTLIAWRGRAHLREAPDVNLPEAEIVRGGHCLWTPVRVGGWRHGLAWRRRSA